METERLILRYFKLDDAKEMFDTWGTDIEVNKYMLWKNYASIKDAEDVIRFYQNEIKNNFICYAIERKIDHKLIGSITISISKKNNHADIGYLLGTDYQNKGYMTEVLNKIIDYYFSKGLVRISAEVMVDNLNSIKLLEKCHFKLEGKLRKKYLKNGKYVDTYLYAIVKEEI